MDVELITDPEALPDLKPQWDDLLSRCGHVTPFMTHEWLMTWWKHFGRTGTLRIVCVRDDGRLVGIAPLEQSQITVRGLPLFRCLNFLGGREADYKDFVLDHDRRWETVETILRFCQEEIPGWQLLICRGLHQCSPNNYLLPVLAGSLGLSHVADAAAVCPYVPLQGEGSDTWSEYRKRGAVREYRRKWGKLQQEHSGRIELAEGEAAIEEFLRLHRLAWGDRGGSQAINTNRLREFHLDLGRADRGNGRVVVALLYAHDQAVAARYHYPLGKIAYEYLTGFDPEWRSLSPGAVLTVGILDLLASRGFEEMDLMRGAEKYKFLFTKVARISRTHVVAKSKALVKRYRLVQAASRSD
jgi:CelD/BcsL family acetyltransferase involved in cellulose biosynthesis